MSDHLAAQISGTARDLKRASDSLSELAAEVREGAGRSQGIGGRDVHDWGNPDCRCIFCRAESAKQVNLAAVPEPTAAVELTEDELDELCHGLIPTILRAKFSQALATERGESGRFHPKGAA